MYRVTRLNPFSWAKAYTLATLVVVAVLTALMVIPFFTVVGFASLSQETATPALVAIPLLCLFSVGGLLLLGIFIFIVALIQGAAFNWALGRTGGLEMDLALGPQYAAAAATPTELDAAATPAALAAGDTVTEPPALSDTATPETVPETTEPWASEAPAPDLAAEGEESEWPAGDAETGVQGGTSEGWSTEPETVSPGDDMPAEDPEANPPQPPAADDEAPWRS